VSLRRLHHTQPESFAFTPANQAWAAEQIAKFPEGRQASAVIPILWRGQEQEGWVTKPMIEGVARMLDLAEIRVLEVATFYFMFHLQPVGSIAHIQVCGTTSCMICGAEDLVGVCKKKIAPNPHELSPDGNFSWEEVECLGACSNAPMAQIGKDYYEDLTAKKLETILATLAKGQVPVPGPQNGRFASEPIKGLTSLKGARAHDANASITLATDKGDTVVRIMGEPPVIRREPAPVRAVKAQPAPEPQASPAPAPEETATPEAIGDDSRPASMLTEARGGKPDDLKKIKGVGPKLEGVLNGLGIYHFDQIADWTPADIAWVDARLQFKGRIVRDGWIDQAKSFASGG
jgi:NADH-quinone oxidoreductase subunit E